MTPNTTPATMTHEEALAVLIQHNAWRRGAEVPAQEPAAIGRAIDAVVNWGAAHARALEAERTRADALAAKCAELDAAIGRLNHAVRKQAHEWEAHPFMPLDMGTAARVLRSLLRGEGEG